MRVDFHYHCGVDVPYPFGQVENVGAVCQRTSDIKMPDVIKAYLFCYADLFLCLVENGLQALDLIPPGDCTFSSLCGCLYKKLPNDLSWKFSFGLQPVKKRPLSGPWLGDIPSSNDQFPQKNSSPLPVRDQAGKITIIFKSSWQNEYYKAIKHSTFSVYFSSSYILNEYSQWKSIWFGNESPAFHYEKQGFFNI